MLLDRLFPVRCAGCERYGAPVCEMCQPMLSELEAKPLAGETLAAFRYEGLARSLVLGLKVRCLRPYARPLGAAMAATAQRSGTNCRWVSWVPARPSAMRQRGFDQAELLAEEVARRAGLGTLPTLRANERRDQVGLGRSMRAQNAETSFIAENGPPGPGDSVLLVDDLMTTGATSRACTKELLAAGWSDVEVLVACRA